MEFSEWRALLAQGPSSETWESIQQAVTQHAETDLFKNEIFPYLIEHLKDWPNEFRMGSESLMNIYSWFRPHIKTKALLTRYFPPVSVGASELENMMKQLKDKIEVIHLSMYDGGDWTGHYSRVVRRKIFAHARSWYIRQAFGGDALGAALISSKCKALEHLQLSIDGYEAYYCSLGLSKSSKINKPKLRTLAFGYYALAPSFTQVLKKASMPSLEAASLTLLSAGGLSELLESKWFPNLDTLQLHLLDYADPNGDLDYRKWMAKRVEGFQADLGWSGDDILSDGRTRVDYDVELLASHSSSSHLRRLSISPDTSEHFTLRSVEAISQSNHLHHLEHLHIPIPKDSASETIQKQLLNNPKLPKLNKLTFTQELRGDDIWESWTIEKDGRQEPLSLSNACILNLFPDT